MFTPICKFNIKQSSQFNSFIKLIICLTLSLLIALTANAAKGGKGKPSPSEPPTDFVADMAFTAPYSKKDKISPLALGMSSMSLINSSNIKANSKSFSPDGKWLVYHTYGYDGDGSLLHMVAVSPVGDLTLQRQSILFYTPDRAVDKTDSIFANVSNPLWLNLSGKNYLLIGHNSDERGKPLYLQFIPLTPIQDDDGNITSWEAEILDKEGRPITKDNRYDPSECNEDPLPEDSTCYLVEFNNDNYYASAVDYGITNSGYALYIIGMYFDVDPRPEILDRYKLFKIPIITSTEPELGQLEDITSTEPELGQLEDITPSHTILDEFKNHRVIAVTGSKILADEVYFSSFSHEQKSGELTLTASSIWKANTYGFDAANNITPITLIYDTVNDPRDPDYFTDLDISCDGVSLLLESNDGKIKLLDVPISFPSEVPPSLLFEGSYPKWKN